MIFFDSLDSLIWFVLAVIIGGLLGIGVAKLVSFYSKKQDVKKVFNIIEGKTKNNLKIEGETIDVNKFTYKEDDGKNKIKVTLADIVEKTQPQGLKEGKIPIEKKRLSFWKRKKVKKK